MSSNSVIAGDLSGLTATGRPISASSSRPRRLSKRSNSSLDQPATGSSSKVSSEIRVSTGSVLEITRPRSVMSRSDRSKEGRVWRSASSEDKLWNQFSQQLQEEQGKRNLGKEEESMSRGAFAATFCQSFLKRPKDDAQPVTDSGTETSSSGTSGTKRAEEEPKEWSSVKTRYKPLHCYKLLLLWCFY